MYQSVSMNQGVSTENSAYGKHLICVLHLLIISPGIHVYVYYMVFAKLLQENYLNNLF